MQDRIQGNRKDIFPLRSRKTLDESRVFSYNKTAKTLTKTVEYIRTAKRAGDGESLVQVIYI